MSAQPLDIGQFCKTLAVMDSEQEMADGTSRWLA